MGRASFHGSKASAPWGLLALGLAAFAACGTKSDPRVVTVYTPIACPVAASVNATCEATGDFSPPADQAISLTSAGASLSELPPAARSMLVEATGFEGVSLVDPAGPVDVLVLPNQEACHLSKSVNPPVSGADPGASFGRIDAHHALLVGGGSEADPPSVIDLGTGGIASASPSLVLARNTASVTPFGTGALVAGGSGPPGSTPPGPFDTAEVYRAAPGGGVGGFMPSPLILAGGPRASHGAVQLATGETLLIGGTDGVHALSSLEYVSPGAAKSVLLSLALSTARVAPSVFRLPTGKIFVGGGFDAMGTPIASVEWLDGDHLIDGASSVIPPIPLCMTATAQGFAPLEGGAVLAVFGAAPPVSCSNVLVIRPDFTVDPAAPLSPPPSPPMLLFPGARSGPVLLTTDQARRWNAWPVKSDQTDEWDALDPRAVPTESEPTTTLFSADPGFGLWLGSDALVWGLRFDRRNAYSTDPLLLSESTSATAPDRLLPSPDVEFTSVPGLTLRNGASVFVTDATFADATIDFTAVAGPFRLILRDNDTGLEFEVGKEGSCFETDLPMATPIRVVRQGATLSAGLSAVVPFTPVSCSVPAWFATARIAVGFRGPPTGSSTIRALSVERTSRD